MLIHYLKVSIRSILKDKAYSLINILGLSVALTCCFLFSFWIKFEFSYDNFYPDVEKIYRVLKEESDAGKLTYYSYYEQNINSTRKLKAGFPQIEAITTVGHEALPFFKEGEADKDGIILDYTTADEDYLRIFPLVYLEGSPQNVVDNKGVIITKDVAQKFFGDASAIGKALYFGNDRFMKSYKIEAVVESFPVNTYLRFDILDLGQRIYSGEMYIKFKESALDPTLEVQISNSLYAAKEETRLVAKAKLQKLRDVHLFSPADIAVGNLNHIYMFSIATLLVLLVAVINYVNTSVARGLKRTKEVGVRKVTGSKRDQLIVRFLLEAFLLTLAATILSFIFVAIIFPEFTSLFGTSTKLDFDILTISIALLFCVLVSVLSGGYTAFYLSSLNPIDALRGGTQTGSKQTMRTALIGFQFMLSVSIIICTFYVYRQIHSMLNADIGVERENIIVLDTGLWYDYEIFIDVLKKGNSNIIDASMAYSAPYNAAYGYGTVLWEGAEEKQVMITQISCDPHYANTFGLELVDGEFIPQGVKWFDEMNESSHSIVVNESFVEMMGEKNPVGMSVNSGWVGGKIVGVVKDFNFKPLKEKITPLILHFNPESSNKIFVKTTGKDKEKTLKYILDLAQEMKPTATNRPTTYYTAEDEFNQMYKAELRMSKIFLLFSAISLILSVMGIVSMISFMIENRAKEIAIRRVFGAKEKDVIDLFIKYIARIALVASLIAIPLCYGIVAYWLQGYTYRTELTWWLFLAIPIPIILVVVALVGMQVYYTAMQNPVNWLRKE